MGKGTIAANLGAGHYSVTLSLSRSRVTQAIAVLTAKAAALQVRIDAMPEGLEKELLKLLKTSVTKQIEFLETNMPENPTVTAWCADLSEELAGMVGTMEIPGERGVHWSGPHGTVMIQPGYEGGAAYNAARDGELEPSVAGDPFAVYWNWAMLPGWQRWMPLWRLGSIAAIDHIANTCTVDLDAAYSTAQWLNINPGTPSWTLHDVPVDYMDCNSMAFEKDDEVVVAFTNQDWAQPVVIGFKDNPKPCNFQFKLTRGDGFVIDNGTREIYFAILKSNGIDYVDITWTYDPITQYWMLIPDDPLQMNDPNGYWVLYYNAQPSQKWLDTQYPYRWKSSEWQDPADLIPVGKYEDTVPYYYWELEIPEAYNWGAHIMNCLTDYPWPEPSDFAISTFCRWATGNLQWKRTIKVTSTVPIQYVESADEVLENSWYRYVGKYEAHYCESGLPSIRCECPTQWYCHYDVYPAPATVVGELLDYTFDPDTGHELMHEMQIYPPGTYSFELSLSYPAFPGATVSLMCYIWQEDHWEQYWYDTPVIGLFSISQDLLGSFVFPDY